MALQSLTRSAQGIPTEIGTAIWRSLPKAVAHGTATITTYKITHNTQSLSATAHGTATLTAAKFGGTSMTLTATAHASVATFSPAITYRVPKATAHGTASLLPIGGTTVGQGESATAAGVVGATTITYLVTLSATAVAGRSISLVSSVKTQTLSATAHGTATLRRSIRVALTVGVQATVSLVRRIGLFFDVTATATPTLTTSPEGSATILVTLEATVTGVATAGSSRQRVEATLVASAEITTFKLVVDQPASAGFRERAGRLGGEDLRARYRLTVSSPAARTWLLSEAEGAPTITTAGVLGIVKGPTPVQATAGIGGTGSAGFTLTLFDHEGTMGQGGRPSGRFSDWFGAAAPYDLDTAVVIVELGWADLGDTDWLIAGHYVVLGYEMSAGPEQMFSISVGEDTRFHRQLPRRRHTLYTWANLPDALVGEPYPLVFGRDQILPLRNVDGDGAVWSCADGPIDTPVHDLKRLWVVSRDTTGDPKLIPLRGNQSLATDASALYKISTPSATKTIRTLNEIAQYLPIPGVGGLASMVKLWLRRPFAVPIGSLTLAIVKDNDGVPGDELVDPNASIEVDAGGLGITTTFTEYTFSFQADGRPTAILIAEGPCWLVVKYANDGGGALNVAVNTSAPHDDGFASYRDTTTDQWIPLGRLKTRQVVRTNFTGQGYLSRLTPSSTALRAPSGSIGYQKVLLVGRDADRFGTGLNRAFLRFKISDFPSGVANAVLIFNLARKGSGASAAELREIVDFGTLNTGHWTQPERGTISATAFTSASDVNDAIIVTVTTAYNAAKAAGLAYFAVKLQLADETESAVTRPYYGILAAGPKAPTLRVTATTGSHLFCYVGHTYVLMNRGSQSPDLNHYAGITIGGEESDTTYGLAVPLRSDVTLAVTVDGMEDNFAGTYTGTPHALIENGADIIRWVARHASRGLALSDDRIDLESFTTARTRLADWFPLAGTIFEPRDSREWMAEIAKACRSTLFINQANQLAIYTEGAPNAAVGTIRPWEHGPLRTAQIPGPGDDTLWPITRLVIYYGRDLLGLPDSIGAPSSQWAKHAGMSRKRDAGWDGFTILSVDVTDPPDAQRQSQAHALTDVYQTRQQGTESPDAMTAYAFVPLEGANGTATGVRLRDWLWDQNYKRARPFDLLEIALPRRALSWRLMEDVLVESWAFPWDATRVRPGEAVWAADGVMDGDAIRFYQARRGLFSIRDLRITAAHGPDYAVVATLKLRGWEV